jgi:hypothetical protein
MHCSGKDEKMMPIETKVSRPLSRLRVASIRGQPLSVVLFLFEIKRHD